ncbi:hypothetical protein ERJ75_000744700 [Trypanosoma vivax]|nr:hypothetical protein ERJ75_000744700 [Trypanosoma vivax]
MKELQSAAGDHYIETHEAINNLVGKLFFLSNCDVHTTLTNVAKSLQALGRCDVGLLTNDDDTSFIFFQSSHFSSRKGTSRSSDASRCHSVFNEAKERIQRADHRSKARFVGIVNAATDFTNQAQTSPPCAQKSKPKEASSFPMSSYERIQEFLRKRRVSTERMRNVSSAAQGQQGTSSRTEGYLLWRYGGKYPKENYYEHYRVHGLKKK